MLSSNISSIVPVVSAASFSLTWSDDVAYPIAIGFTVALTGQDHCIYVFGGQDSAGTTSTSYKFNATAGSLRGLFVCSLDNCAACFSHLSLHLEWTSINSMPAGVANAAGCVANDGRFFIFGGYENNRTSPSFIQIYSAAGDSWSTTTPMIPSGASIADFHMSCAVDSNTGLMYLTGGDNKGNRFYIYNVSSNSITDLSSSSPFSSLSGHGSFVANNGKFYVFGGCCYSAATYIYAIATSNWSTGASMMQAAAWFGYATNGSRFYVIGGYNGSSYLQNTQVYDISANVWSVDNGIVFAGEIYTMLLPSWMVVCIPLEEVMGHTPFFPRT